MSFVLQPWQVFFVTLAAWVNREQQATIEFYQVELEAMMKAQGKKRLLLTDDQRRLLAELFAATFWSFPREFWTLDERLRCGKFSVSFQRTAKHTIIGLKDFPLLPGKIVQEVQSTVSPRGFSDAKPPIMVGEFRDEEGHDYVMLVNLSLEGSANIKIGTIKSYKAKQVFSAEDGRLLPLDEDNGRWLLAGHGVLVKFE